MQDLFGYYYYAPDRNSWNYVEWLEANGGKTADDYGHESVIFTDEDWTAFRLRFEK
jgi:hypothetical protein